MKVYYDRDADLSLLRRKKIAIIGYGSQGHAHALNLRDSGMDVRVGLRKGSASIEKAQKNGLKVLDTMEAAQEADIIMMLVPDEQGGEIYEKEIAPALKARQVSRLRPRLQHPFRIHQAAQGRQRFHDRAEGPGTSGALRVCERDAAFRVSSRCSRIPRAIPPKSASPMARRSAARARPIIETSFKEETETDLFGEQSVLCGGLTELIRAGFETLVEAGYAPEMAYFECVHEVKLIVDLIYEGGISNMRYSISNTAEYGDMTRGKKVVSEDARKAMKQILADIQSGKFANEWISRVSRGAAALPRDAQGRRASSGRGSRQKAALLHAVAGERSVGGQGTELT